VPSLTTSDGRTLAWREAGAGPPLLCHPGGPGCSSRYFGDLPELAEERALLLLDPRGTGDSDRPADSSAYDLEQYAVDVEAVREHLGIERLDFLGHSHGGFVAMSWAGANPERVGRLVLANTAPRFTDTIRQARMQRVASHQGQPYFADAMDALRAHQEGRYANDEELMALYARESRLFVPVGTDMALAIDALTVAGTNADALRHFNDNISSEMDLRPQLGRVEAPTLVITGELDPFGESTAREIADALPNATLIVLPDVDHFPFMEPGNRASWSRAVLDFLTG
jgi:pimeloyl-ACP methyl ester carboxylesterase